MVLKKKVIMIFVAIFILALKSPIYVLVSCNFQCVLWCTEHMALTQLSGIHLLTCGCPGMQNCCNLDTVVESDPLVWLYFIMMDSSKQAKSFQLCHWSGKLIAVMTVPCFFPCDIY